MFLRAEVDGRAAGIEDLSRLAVVNHGHFTTAQVRDGRVRGFSLHLARLDAASREVFATGLEGERVRSLVGHALGDDLRSASLRVTVFPSAAGDGLSVLVTLRPPAEPPAGPRALQSVRYVRPLAHVKHVGTFPQIHYGGLARRAGFDDALLTGAGGAISETTVANIGFLLAGTLVWPAGPSLRGVTMQLLERTLPFQRRALRLDDLRLAEAAFVANSSGLVAVARIDERQLPLDAALMRRLADAYAAAPWEDVV